MIPAHAHVHVYICADVQCIYIQWILGLKSREWGTVLSIKGECTVYLKLCGFDKANINTVS